MPESTASKENRVEVGAEFATQIGDKVWELETESDILPFPEPPPELPPEPPKSRKVEPSRKPPKEEVSPPSASQLIEAMLFVGGTHLQAEQACQIIRGLTVDQFQSLISELNQIYRQQNRPYTIQQSSAGYSLQLRSRYRSIRERLIGSPREARLTQPALDTLSLVAYRQPITRAEVDSLRGSESSVLLRSLVRLGLIAILQRAESGPSEVYYGTTPRFLELFNLRTLDDLPTLGEPERI